jgi:hypothetical protein
MQTASDQAFWLIVMCVCLATCFVRVFWDIEEARRRRRQRRDLVRDARRAISPSQ